MGGMECWSIGTLTLAIVVSIVRAMRVPIQEAHAPELLDRFLAGESGSLSSESSRIDRVQDRLG